jgi:peptide methionine sulfoxide reductase MsrA
MGHSVGNNEETAVLAGGCYWIMQQLPRGCDGVMFTRVGRIGRLASESPPKH